VKDQLKICQIKNSNNWIFSHSPTRSWKQETV